MPLLPWSRFTVIIDTNCIGTRDSNEHVKKLFNLEKENKIEIIKTDVVDTELSEKGREYSKDIPEDLGVAISDNSRIGYGVIAGDDDVLLHDKIMKILFPETKGEDPNNNKIRDVMNLTTHIKSNRDIFVTLDGDFLRKREELKNLSVIIMTPEECNEYVKNCFVS